MDTLGHFPVGLENVLDGVPKLGLSMADRVGSTLMGSPPSGEVHPIIIPHSVPIMYTCAKNRRQTQLDR